MIWNAPHHPGDRIIYEGREYRAVSVNWQHAHADLVDTATGQEFLPAVHLSHLTMSWCPQRHGGKGRPRDTATGGDHCTTCQGDTHHADHCRTIDGKVKPDGPLLPVL